MYMNMSVCVQCPQQQEEVMRFPETGVIDGSELPYGCGESNSSPLQERPVLLAAKLSLQPPGNSFIETQTNQNIA